MDVLELQLGAKQQASANRRQCLSSLHDQLLPILSPKLRSVLLSSEQGSSSWLKLTTLPYQIMATLYIKEPFVMPFVFNMVGSPPPCLKIVFVGSQ